MRPLLLLLLSAVLAFPTAARPRGVAHRPAFTVPGIDAIAANATNDGVPGITISVRKGNAFFTRSWGNTQPQTVYQVASVTKQFTAAAIMRLVEEGGSSRFPIARGCGCRSSMRASMRSRSSTC